MPTTVSLDFGTLGLAVTLPAVRRLSVLEPARGEPLANPMEAIRAALASPVESPPLSELARGRRDAVVVISDKTRPIPYGIVLPPLLATLEEAGVPPARIEILVATGLHRPNTPDELAAMTSPELVARYRFRNHVARRPEEHVHLGRTQRGTEIWLDRGFLEADLRVVTGLIEPHLIAGFSGGRKAICPGLAGVETMKRAHGPAMLEDRVGPGIVDGNPFHEDLIEIARRSGVHFMCDVTLDRQRRLTGVHAGDIVAAHAHGVQAVEAHVRVDLDEPADVVLTSAGGFPLDETFYQSIKGLTAALNVVKPGGTLILAAAMGEGMGSDDFCQLLRTASSNDEMMARLSAPGFFQPDQWMVQHLCQVIRKAEVLVVGEGFDPAGVGGLPVRPAPSVEAALAEALRRHGDDVHLAVMPQGPYVLPTVRGRKLSLGRAWEDAA